MPSREKVFVTGAKTRNVKPAGLKRFRLMKREKIGTIKGIDLIRKSAPRAEISFRTGKHMTEKDRPRDKSYKRHDFSKD